MMPWENRWLPICKGRLVIAGRGFSSCAGMAGALGNQPGKEMSIPVSGDQENFRADCCESSWGCVEIGPLPRKFANVASAANVS